MRVLGEDETGAADGIAVLENILNSMGQGMLLVDAGLSVVAANSLMHEIFGQVGAEPANGRPLADVIGIFGPAAGEEQDSTAEILEKAQAGSPLAARRTTIGDLTLELRGHQVPGLGYLLAFCDISEQVRAERDEREGGRRVREILDDSPIGVNIIGPDSMRRYANRKMAEMLGYAVEDLPGVHPSVHYADPSARERVIQGILGSGSVDNMEVEFVRKDGTPFWVLLSGQPFRYHGEDCILGWVYEITDRIELEKRQLRSREELEIQILELRDREDRMAEQAAELESLAIKLSESEQRMAELANQDPLTGLPTARLCHDRIEQAIALSRREQTLLALFYLDLDGFKEVNDTYGHDAGDAVLREAAERMKGCFREVDTVSRIGGDEFLIVLSGLGFRDVVVPLAERLLNRFSEEFSFDEGRAQIGVSIGIAFFNSASDTAETLIKRADKAMYEAKRNGKNGYVIA